MKITGMVVAVVSLAVPLVVGAPPLASRSSLQSPQGQERARSHDAQHSTNGYSRSAIDVHAEKLPPGYLGIDSEFLYRSLERSSSSKGKTEFESTEDYQNRVERESTRPLIAGLSGRNVFAFVLEGSPPDVTVEYDADEERMHVFVIPSWERTSGVEGAGNRLTLRTKHKIQKYDTYTATNAFGAKVQVESFRSSQFLIAFSEPFGFRLSKHSVSKSLNITQDAIRFDFPVVKPQAAHLKARMGVLVVCRLARPNVAEYSEHNKPQFDDPVEVRTHEYYIGVELLQIWIYDKSSGEILSKAGNEIEVP